MNENIFNKLYSIDFKGKVDKKGAFNYISWASAWAELQKICPEVLYEIVKFNDLPYKENQNGECIVFTKMTIGGIQHEMWLPVMDNKNQAKKNPSMMDINKAIMRCLVKNMAMFGLGLKVYEGEDLVDVDNERKPAENNIRKITTKELNELQQLISDSEKDSEKLCIHYKINSLSELTYNQYLSAKATCEKAINDMN